MSTLIKKRNTLHIVHSWGGGVERWLKSYCEEDANNNFLLRSLSKAGSSCDSLQLYDFSKGEALSTLELPYPIEATDIYNPAYKEFLHHTLKVHQIDLIIISSLIGHSLDALAIDFPKIFIYHDYYPFCPVINIYFNGICKQCSVDDLSLCFEKNPLNHLFENMSAPAWNLLRENFIRTILEKQIICIAPSPSVKKNYLSFGDFAQNMDFHEISHGVNSPDLLVTHSNPESSSVNTYESIHTSPKNKPRILILGRLSFLKGFLLFKDIYAELKDEFNFFLVGCGELPPELRGQSEKLYVVEEYKHEELEIIVRETNPDIGLLLSIWPETFSFTLSELMVFQIPVLATRCGSFSDRMTDGVTGFLANPNAESMIGKIRDIFTNPAQLAIVKGNLKSMQHKTVKQMLVEYQTLTEELVQEASKSVKFVAGEKPHLGQTKSMSLKEVLLKILKEQEEVSLPDVKRCLEQLNIKEEIEHQKIRNKLKMANREIQSLQEEVVYLCAQIKAMESSKFWRIREAWLRFKQFFYGRL